MTSYSKCCNDTVRVGGDGETHWYICNQCEKPCDVIGQGSPVDVLAHFLKTLMEEKP